MVHYHYDIFLATFNLMQTEMQKLNNNYTNLKIYDIFLATFNLMQTEMQKLNNNYTNLKKEHLLGALFHELLFQRDSQTYLDAFRSTQFKHH